MRLTACLALALLSTPAMAQAPEPRMDFLELQKAAMADPAIKAALAAPDRSTGERLRDEARMTALILKETGARPGMRVLDVGSGSGYLAVLLSTLVGEKGHVDIHNTPGWINQFPGMDPEVEKRRIKRANIGYITTSWNDIPSEPKGGYDLIVLGQVFNDVGLEAGDYNLMCANFFGLLKPGGRLVIEDHDALDGQMIGDQVNLHRISHGDVEKLLLGAGFALKELVLMDSKYDNRKMNVFFPGVRGRTDRFIAVFEKPGG